MHDKLWVSMLELAGSLSKTGPHSSSSNVCSRACFVSIWQTLRYAGVHPLHQVSTICTCYGAYVAARESLCCPAAVYISHLQGSCAACCTAAGQACTAGPPLIHHGFISCINAASHVLWQQWQHTAIAKHCHPVQLHPNWQPALQALAVCCTHTDCMQKAVHPALEVALLMGCHVVYILRSMVL